MLARSRRLNAGGIVTPPPPPYNAYPTLPNPGVAENGAVHCNEPLIRNGKAIGFCDRYVKPSRRRWRRQHLTSHRGPHRIEWWSS